MTDIPTGYMQDAQGNLVPEGNVKPQHKLEDELVRRLAASAQSIHDDLAAFKRVALGEALAFRAMVAEEYGAKKGGAKGNMTLRSFDGSFELQVAVSDNLSFGPELLAAKELVDNCLDRWYEGSDDNIKALVNHAFQVNKQGRIDTQRVLGLRRLDMRSDEEWGRAMDAISDAVRVTSTKTYLRFYETDRKTGVRKPISLDLAAL
jgi:uncharacterized protein DUF3164